MISLKVKSLRDPLTALVSLLAFLLGGMSVASLSIRASVTPDKQENSAKQSSPGDDAESKMWPAAAMVAVKGSYVGLALRL